MQADIATIDQYLASNNIDAIKDAGGIRFHIDKLGTTGFPPRSNQSVKVAYKGMLMNGTVFDQNANATFRVDGVILGWQYLLTIWPEGTKGTVWVPSPLGYADRPVGSIPANSILVFEVELKDVIVSGADQTRLVADVATIDKYLKDNSIDAVRDTTGISYVINDPGTGAPPSLYSKVKFSYSGKVIPGGSQAFNGSSQPSETFDSRPADFLSGMKFGLMKIGKGGKVTVFVPSGLAYGSEINTQSPVVPNSNVQFDLEITEIF